MTVKEQEKTTYHELEIKIRVVTDREWQPESITDIAYEIGDGEFVGVWEVTKNDEVTPRQAADLLNEFGSEPGFFSLDEDGNPDDGEDDEEEDPETPP